MGTHAYYHRTSHEAPAIRGRLAALNLEAYRTNNVFPGLLCSKAPTLGLHDDLTRMKHK